MILNAVKSEDEDETQLLLQNNPISRVSSFKYLGIHLSANHKNTNHLNKRKTAVQDAKFKLNTIGILDECVSPNTKGRMYSTYIMPVLTHGWCNLSLNSKELDDLETLEDNTIKYVMGLWRRCKSKLLLRALNIVPTRLRYRMDRLKHFLRMHQNEYVSELMLEMETIANLTNRNLIADVRVICQSVETVEITNINDENVLDGSFEHQPLEHHRSLVERCRIKLKQIVEMEETTKKKAEVTILKDMLLSGKRKKELEDVLLTEELKRAVEEKEIGEIYDFAIEAGFVSEE